MIASCLVVGLSLVWGVGVRFETPVPVDLPQIQNAFRVSPRLYSGGDPPGDAAFEALRALGVRTLVSVDGATPDVEGAHRHGMRYVHLPIGYDGISPERIAELVAVREREAGPIFVHCHHGQHRGPTAVAICAMADDAWTAAQARAWLEQAGTSPNYLGLYATVERYKAPSREAVQAVGELPEVAKVADLVTAMVGIDRTWEEIKAIEQAGFRTPPAQPDLDAPHSALQLTERFRETLRATTGGDRSPDFAEAMQAAERHAEGLEKALRALADRRDEATLGAVEQSFRALGQSCNACHARFRNEIE